MSDERSKAALERLGAAPVEPPNALFADGLEERLRAQYAWPSTPSAPPGRVRRGALRAVALAAVVLVLAGVAVARLPDTSSDTLVLSSAQDTTVVFPDGRVMEAAAGLSLPEGTLIITGVDGTVEASGVRIQPDSLAVVEDGRMRLLEPDPRRPALPTPTDRSTTTTTRVGTTTTTSDDPSVSRPTSPTTSTTANRPSTSTTAVPRADLPWRGSPSRWNASIAARSD